MVYPTHYRVGFHDRRKLREVLLKHVIYRPASKIKLNSSSKRNNATSPSNRQHLRNLSSNRNAATSPSTNREHSRNVNTKRSRTPSSNKENTKGYRPQIHGQYEDQAQPSKSISRSRYPTVFPAQQQQIPREKSSSRHCDDDADEPQKRFKIAPAGYYKSPNYLRDHARIDKRCIEKELHSTVEQSSNSKERTDSTASKENNKQLQLTRKQPKRKVRTDSTTSTTGKENSSVTTDTTADKENNKQLNSTLKQSNSRETIETTEITASKENKKPMKKRQTESECCSKLRPDYILGQRDPCRR